MELQENPTNKIYFAGVAKSSCIFFFFNIIELLKDSIFSKKYLRFMELFRLCLVLVPKILF